MEKKNGSKQTTKARRYGMPLTKEDIEMLGIDPNFDTSVIRKIVREKLGLPNPMTQRERLCVALGLPVGSSAAEIREATLKKFE